MKRREAPLPPLPKVAISNRHHSEPSISQYSPSRHHSTQQQQRRNNSIATTNPIYHHEVNTTTTTSSTIDKKRQNSNSWLPHNTTSSNHHLSSSTSSNGYNSYYSQFDPSNEILFFGNSLPKSQLWKLIPLVILMVVPWIPTQQTRYEMNQRQMTINQMLKEQRKVVKELNGITFGVKDLKFDNEVLLKQNNDLYVQLSAGVTTADKNNNQKNRYQSPDNLSNENYLKEEEVEEQFLTRIDELEKHIQDQSLQRIEKR